MIMIPHNKTLNLDSTGYC